jgi:hypothetical protein
MITIDLLSTSANQMTASNQTVGVGGARNLKKRIMHHCEQGDIFIPGTHEKRPLSIQLSSLDQ